MIFTETRLAGAYMIDIERRPDERGYFARVFCREEFAAIGLTPAFAQANVSHNRVRGTLRGLHFQYPPVAESKYVRCTRGALLDVIVDLRPESVTYLEHVAIRLSAADGRGLYVPNRFAHGFLTLEDETEVVYLMGQAHAPGAEGGLPFDDPALAIDWPIPVRVVSDRDRQWRPICDIAPTLRDRMTILEPNHA
jgi:dTDP-4-dehydrorhamnose 3,5-epimerase